MFTTYRPTPDVHVVTTTTEIPMLGSLAINAFVLDGPEPMLVDAGPVASRDEFMTALRSVIDPTELRWLWLTHPDYDHIGAIPQLLEENPDLRIITTFMAVGFMGLSSNPLPMDRVCFLNSGETATFGHRTVTAYKPPAFDNPITTGFFDHTSGALFSSDCFGALLGEMPTAATDIPPADLRAGQVFWTTVDSAWLHQVDRSVLAANLEATRRIEPQMVFSSHLPAARGHLLPALLDAIGAVPDAPHFAGPDQAALEQMLASMSGAPEPVGTH
jgi:flavorubredoxin